MIDLNRFDPVPLRPGLVLVRDFLDQLPPDRLYDTCELAEKTSTTYNNIKTNTRGRAFAEYRRTWRGKTYWGSKEAIAAFEAKLKEEDADEHDR